MRTLVFVLLAVISCQARVYANKDSIGVKTVAGKLYILHKVGKGEGLYGIGRRYNVSVPNIEQADPSVKDGIDPGDVVMVPAWKRGTFKTGNNTASSSNTSSNSNKSQPQPKQEPQTTPPVKKPQPEVKNPAPQDKTAIYHVVKPGETLFAIANKENVAVADIQKWNGLKSNTISAGQKLIVGYTGQPASKEEVTEKEKPEVGPEGTKNPNLKEDHIDPKITTEYEAEQKRLEAERKKGRVEMKEVNESGVATWIDENMVTSEKKLALHRTAPVGTIIQLTNPRTGKRVYVKVIGHLPDAVEEQNVVIKVTKNTADELGAIDKFFRVEMSYGVEVITTVKK
jgi:LysM repeat protein